MGFKMRSHEIEDILELDRQGVSEECAAFLHTILNYDSCYSTLYIFWKVICFSFQ